MSSVPISDLNVALSRRKVVLGLLFASAAGVAAIRQPYKNLNFLGERQLEDIVPHQIGGWSFETNSGLVVPPEDQLAQAVYSQLLTRIYSRPDGQIMMLLVAQSATQTGILQIHRPEFCYTAGGFRISPTSLHPVHLSQQTVPALTLEASNGGLIEQIVYWTRIGDRMPTSWRDQKLVVAMDNLRRVIPDAVMVRVSTYSADRAGALQQIENFIASLLKSMTAADRRIFIA